MENFVGSPSLPATEIRRLVRSAYRRYYLRPGHIFRLLRLVISHVSFGRFIGILPYSLSRIFGEYVQVRR